MTTIAPASPAGTVTEERRASIAVVDDDSGFSGYLRTFLALRGYEARSYTRGDEIVAAIRQGEPPDIVLLDVAMPGMSGPELQQELIRRQQDIPIVFITANGDKTIRPRLLAQGAAECLFKPFSEAALLDALDAALRMR